ncbi:MAG: hypothetical protein TYPL_0190 [Candidatus Tyloplasma litorale]|nr:MAG: hypothetical protein TYPL_0190 [Mycoplasmatales bacterium]
METKIKVKDNNFLNIKEENNIKTDFKRSLLITKFNLKWLLNNKKTLLFVMIFFVSSVFLVTTYIPWDAATGAILLMYLIVPELIVLGTIGYDVRESTIYNNLNMSGISRNSFHFSSLLTTFIIGILLSVIFWPIIWIVSLFDNVILNDWIFANTVHQYHVNILAGGSIINLIYSILLTSFVSFAFYFAIHSWAKNLRVYYFWVMSMFILGIIFGGSLNSFFLRPINSTSILSGDSILFTKVFVNNSEQTLRLSFVDEQYMEEVKAFSQLDVSNSLSYGYGLFPDAMFVPSLFYPFFGVGQFCTVGVGGVATLSTLANNGSKEFVIFVPPTIDNFDAFVNLVNSMGSEEIASYIDSGYIMSSTILSTYGWQSVWGFSMESYAWRWTVVMIQPYLVILFSFIVGLIGSKLRSI